VLSQLGYRVGGGWKYFFARFENLGGGLGEMFRFDTAHLGYTITTLSILLAAAVLAVLFMRRDFAHPRLFLTAGLVTALPACSLLSPFGTTRYFLPLFIFLMLAVASFVQPLSGETSAALSRATLRRNAGLLAALGLAVLYTAGTASMRLSYNFTPGGRVTYEETAYRQAVDYLRQAGAKKVYAVNPIITALAPDIGGTTGYDTFGLLFVMDRPARDLVADQQAQGVSYTVLDGWAPLFAIAHAELRPLVAAIEQAGDPAATLVPETLVALEVRIYAPRAPQT